MLTFVYASLIGLTVYVCILLLGLLIKLPVKEQLDHCANIVLAESARLDGVKIVCMLVGF
jgi:hypothetical protein